MSDYYWRKEELDRIVEADDKEGFVNFLHRYPNEVTVDLVAYCSTEQAKNCLIALVSGEVCEPPPALEGCTTCIHTVVLHFPDFDVVNLMLMRGAINDLNINYKFHDLLSGTPLQLLFYFWSIPTKRFMHLGSWSPGDSILKLITLLCMPEMKQRLDIARKFAQYTDSINDIAWCFLENGKLLQLAALLLVAQNKVMVPFETGLTIQQHLTNKIDKLSSEVHLDIEQSQYKSLLMDASKLFDVFERTGDDLSTYCSSMRKNVSPEKVVFDVMGLFRKAGLMLQVPDLDLRDCYRGHLGLWKSNLFKLSDSPKLDNKFPSHIYPTSTGLSTASGVFPSCRHWDPLVGKIKSGELLKLAASIPRPRLLSTVAGAGSSNPVKRLTNVAVKLKRAIRL